MSAEPTILRFRVTLQLLNTELGSERVLQSTSSEQISMKKKAEEAERFGSE